MNTTTVAQMTKGHMYDVTVRRPGRRSYTYRFAEMVNRQLDDAIMPWVAIWQHHSQRSAVLAIREVISVVER